MPPKAKAAADTTDETPEFPMLVVFRLVSGKVFKIRCGTYTVARDPQNGPYILTLYDKPDRTADDLEEMHVLSGVKQYSINPPDDLADELYADEAPPGMPPGMGMEPVPAK